MPSQADTEASFVEAGAVADSRNRWHIRSRRKQLKGRCRVLRPVAARDPMVRRRSIVVRPSGYPDAVHDLTRRLLPASRTDRLHSATQALPRGGKQCSPSSPRSSNPPWLGGGRRFESVRGSHELPANWLLLAATCCLAGAQKPSKGTLGNI